MKLTKLTILLLGLLMITSCNMLEQEYYGVYKGQNNKYIDEVLELNTDHTYELQIFRKKDSMLLLFHRGMWHDEDEGIILEDFYPCSDEVYEEPFEDISEFTITTSISVENKVFQDLKLHHKPPLDEYYLLKMD